MPFGKQIATALGVAWTVLSAAQIADASESGSYESISSVVTDYTKFEHAGQDVTGGPLNGTDTIIKSSGGPFVEGASNVMVCLVFAKKSNGGIDLEAPCTLTDSSGEKLFMLSKRSTGDTVAGSGGEGRQQILGGTGKYADLTGSCTYEVNYLTENRAVTRRKCAWQKP